MFCAVRLQLGYFCKFKQHLKQTTYSTAIAWVRSLLGIFNYHSTLSNTAFDLTPAQFLGFVHGYRMLSHQNPNGVNHFRSIVSTGRLIRLLLREQIIGKISCYPYVPYQFSTRIYLFFRGRNRHAEGHHFKPEPMTLSAWFTPRTHKGPTFHQYPCSCRGCTRPV